MPIEHSCRTLRQRSDCLTTTVVPDSTGICCTCVYVNSQAKCCHCSLPWWPSHKIVFSRSGTAAQSSTLAPSSRNNTGYVLLECSIVWTYLHVRETKASNVRHKQALFSVHVQYSCRPPVRNSYFRWDSNLITYHSLTRHESFLHVLNRKQYGATICARYLVLFFVFNESEFLADRFLRSRPQLYMHLLPEWREFQATSAPAKTIQSCCVLYTTKHACWST